MGIGNVPSVVLYAYPLLLYAVRLLCPLLFRHTIEHHESKRRKNLLSGIWYLQLILSSLLLVTAILAAPEYISAIRRKDNIKTAEARLISYASVALYYFAGLLPHADGPWNPEMSHACAWVIAALLEGALLLFTDNLFGKFPAWNVALGIARFCVLSSMVVIFLVTQRDCLLQHLEPKSTRSALLAEENGTEDYGTINTRAASNEELAHRGKGGWLDYFIGFRILFPYIWPSGSPKQQFILLVSLVLVITQRVINILVPWQLEVLVESLGRGKMPYKNIFVYITCRALQGQQGILGSGRAILWIPVSQALFRRLTCAAFEHILELSLDMHLSKRIGEVMSALNKGSALNTFLDGFAFQLFPMVFDLGIAAVYFLIRMDAFYSLIIIGVMWTYIYMTIYMAKWRARARREMATRDREMDAAKMDTLMSYETVHHNGAVPLETKRFGTHVAAYQGSEYSVLFSLNALNITQNMVLTLGILLVVMISAFQISLGIHSVAMFVGILGYFTQLQAPLQFFGSFYNQVQTNLVEAERMLDLFKQKPTIVDSANATEMSHCSGWISFRNVSFAYDARQSTLRNISFDVKPGSSTAIVGESGSGKSTCLKLLYRFYDVTSGEVTIDGSDVRDLKIRSFRKHIGVVPQDTILFNMSIMYNLQYAKPDATIEEIYDACRAASIHEKIMAFPEGYDTKVGERGLRLSGGEKQRIAIARAILKDPQIILLDEATASLDSKTEQRIKGALDAVTKGRTTITIAHRLSTITNSDQILVLHQGTIEERGTHEELLARGGRYKQMWEKQTKIGQSQDEDSLLE